MKALLDSLATVVLCSWDATVSGDLANGITYSWNVNWETLLEKLPIGKYACVYDFYGATMGTAIGGSSVVNTTVNPFISRQQTYTICCNLQTAASSSTINDRRAISATTYNGSDGSQMLHRTNTSTQVWYGGYGSRNSETKIFICDNPTLTEIVQIKFTCRQVNTGAAPIGTPATTANDSNTRGIHVFQFKLMK